MRVVRKVPVLLIAAAALGATPGDAGAWARPGAHVLTGGATALGPAATRLAGASAAAEAAATGRDHVGRAPVPSPQIATLDTATRTLYVSSDTLDVALIDARRC